MIGAAVGMIAGFAVAVGGAIKDAPYEGFDQLKFLRSPIIGIIEGHLLQTAFAPQLTVLSATILFLASVGAERITTEVYKLVRAKKPMKFTFGEWGVRKKVKPQ